jgi:hypothetical protein
MESILKSKKGKFIDKLVESIEKYDTSYHVGIGCFSIEAITDKSGKVMIENSPESMYAKGFMK